MKLGAILAAVLLAVGALAATYWIARGGSTTSAASTTSTSTSEEPTPAKTGPYPKAVVPEKIYEFGTMRMGESKEHVFVIRNEGEAPLKLGAPRTTCQCTVPELAKKVLLPGEETTIKVKWTPAAETENFDKGAFISTNDPKMPQINFAGVGRVEQLLITFPHEKWEMGSLKGGTDNEITGYIYSRLLDHFDIKSIESSNPLLTAKAVPAGPDDLKTQEAKCGYKITASLSPGMPVGKFKETLTIKTDVDDTDAATKKVEVSGTRHGPVQIIPTPGVKWNPTALALDLGRFSVAKGASGTVSLFVSGLPDNEELKFESVKISDPSVEVSLKHDTDFKAENRQRYELTFRVPPGGPAVAHRANSAVKIEAKTNHPEAQEMKFYVEFIATQ